MFSFRRLTLATALFLGGTCAGAALTVPVLAYQGHMWAAVADLQAARNQLTQAAADKDGHRVSALELVNRAIAQTRAGIKAGAE